MNARNRDSCRQLFKNLKILPLKSLYVFPFYYLLPKNKDSYESNWEIHNINTRFSSHLHTPTANLTTFQIVKLTYFLNGPWWKSFLVRLRALPELFTKISSIVRCHAVTIVHTQTSLTNPHSNFAWRSVYILQRTQTTWHRTTNESLKRAGSVLANESLIRCTETTWHRTTNESLARGSSKLVNERLLRVY